MQNSKQNKIKIFHLATSYLDKPFTLLLFTIIFMHNIAKKFYSLRVYKKISTFDIANLILCNRLMGVKSFVGNSPQIYKYSNRLFGSKLTNYLINNTFCKALTAGNTLEQAEKVAARFRNQNIPVIFDYCAEGVIGQQGSQDALDQNAKLFLQSAEQVCHNQSQMISIKITALVDMQLLKRINDSVVIRNQFWEKYSEDGKLSGRNLFKGLQNIYSGISDQQFKKYLRNIYIYEGVPEEFSIDETQFKMKHLPYYIGDAAQQKNQDFVIRLFLPLNKIEKHKLELLAIRLETICKPFIANRSQFKILVDAEQSYVQRAIEVMSEQLQQIYNKQRLYIIPTIQNYLTISVSRTTYQVEIAKRKNIWFGAKLVRGAYIVQQTNLAKKYGYKSPIVDSYEKTTQNYLTSFKTIVTSKNKGEVFVATHSQYTILQTAKILSTQNTSVKVNYAQLLGLADHLTFKTKEQGFKVYKLLPWAKPDVMIWYMIRRAQQLSQMRYPLDIQFELLKHQLRVRYLK